MPLLCLRDKGAIEAWLRRDAAVHLYELGDLDDFFWPFTTWYGLPSTRGTDELDAIALVYAATALPVLLVMGREADLPVARAMVEAVAPRMPSRFYAHLVPGSAEVLARSFDLAPHGRHERLVLVDRRRIDAVDTRDAVQLGPDDEPALTDFYARAYPDNWFDARMLATGAYFAVRRAGAIVSVAGVHVVSPRHRVAALGNIATDPAVRGQGLARVATAAACKSLASMEPLGLNVASDNHAALALYGGLGFARVTSYEEHLATAKTPSALAPP